MRKKDPKDLENMLEKKVAKDENKPITKNTEIRMSNSTQIAVQMKAILGEPNCKILSIRFDEDDKYIAAACDNAQIQIYNVNSGKLSYVLNGTNKDQKHPFSCVRWRPKSGNMLTKNVLVTTNADGEIQHWHMTSGKCLHTIKENIMDLSLNGLDYNNDGTKFVVVGSDPTVKIYDEETRKLEYKLTGEGCVIPGHNSRVFCGKFNHEDPNILVTGGWDQRVLVWDIRDKTPVRSMYGPLICGDAIDIFEEVILTSSWTQTNQLQMWELGTGKLITTVKWEDGYRPSADPTLLYSGQFSKNDGSLILAGGSNSYEARVFDRNNLDKNVCVIYDMSREIDAVDFANKGDKFAIAGGDGYVRIFSMNIIA